MLKERNNVLWTGGLATMSGLGMNNCNNVKGKKEEFVQLLQSQYINGFSLGNGQLVINVFPNLTLVLA